MGLIGQLATWLCNLNFAGFAGRHFENGRGHIHVSLSESSGREPRYLECTHGKRVLSFCLQVKQGDKVESEVLRPDDMAYTKKS